ncbi:transposase [unidentified bacterial endosymbiont]|uniref:transposase n=1 Tax=unidentified bacterial endosymbiont TaxID=2355 RepID=UPI0020A09C6B|nr:transposase [unidentified bacterial endosymbiont]
MNQGESRSYDKEFKLNAVKLYHSTGKTLCQLSEELGVPMILLPFNGHNEEEQSV